MFTLSLFTAPSRTDTVTSSVIFNITNAASVIQQALDDHTNDPIAPSYFSFSSWNKFHERSSYLGSSAIVLEYSKRSDAEWALIADAIENTGLKVFAFDTVKGIAFAFPVQNCRYNNTYARILSILAELIGQTGMIADASATYLVKPKKGAKVYEMGTDIISSDFTDHFKGIPADGLKQWTVAFLSQNPTRDLNPPKPAQAISIVAVKQKTMLDDLFDMLDGHLATVERSVIELETIRDALKAAASQQGRGSLI